MLLLEVENREEKQSKGKVMGLMMELFKGNARRLRIQEHVYAKRKGTPGYCLSFISSLKQSRH